MTESTKWRLSVVAQSGKAPVEEKHALAETPEQIEAAILPRLREGWKFVAPRPENTRPEVNFGDPTCREEKGAAFKSFTLDELRRLTGRKHGDESQDQPLLDFLDSLSRRRRIKILRIRPRAELHFTDVEILCEIGEAIRRHGTGTIPTVELSRSYFDNPLSKAEIPEGSAILLPSQVILRIRVARDSRFSSNFGKPDGGGALLAEIRQAQESQKADLLAAALRKVSARSKE
jgi:hypothetical protein